MGYVSPSKEYIKWMLSEGRYSAEASERKWWNEFRNSKFTNRAMKKAGELLVSGNKEKEEEAYSIMADVRKQMLDRLESAKNNSDDPLHFKHTEGKDSDFTSGRTSDDSDSYYDQMRAAVDSYVYSPESRHHRRGHRNRQQMIGSGKLRAQLTKAAQAAGLKDTAITDNILTTRGGRTSKDKTNISDKQGKTQISTSEPDVETHTSKVVGKKIAHQEVPSTDQQLKRKKASLVRDDGGGWRKEGEGESPEEYKQRKTETKVKEKSQRKDVEGEVAAATKKVTDPQRQQRVPVSQHDDEERKKKVAQSADAISDRSKRFPTYDREARAALQSGEGRGVKKSDRAQVKSQTPDADKLDKQGSKITQISTKTASDEPGRAAAGRGTTWKKNPETGEPRDPDASVKRPGTTRYDDIAAEVRKTFSQLRKNQKNQNKNKNLTTNKVVDNNKPKPISLQRATNGNRENSTTGLNLATVNDKLKKRGA